MAVEIYGSDKIVVGTDTPIFSAETGLRVINETRLSEEDKQKILRENAIKLLSR